MTVTNCPCGAWLESRADLAHHVCEYCRIDAKKRPPRKRKVLPDFVDVPLPGLETWGLPMVAVTHDPGQTTARQRGPGGSGLGIRWRV